MSNYGRKAGPNMKELDEVEELLRATEDEMVLKLSVNSHSSHTSSSSSSQSPLDHDLIRRFETLKTPVAPKKTTSVPPPPGSTQSKKQSKDEKKASPDESDLAARFSALKGGRGGSLAVESQVPPARSDGSEDEENEVEKLIEWAKDAARLDPSKSDDEEDEKEEEEDESEEEDSDVEDEERSKKKKKEKPPPPPPRKSKFRWFG